MTTLTVVKGSSNVTILDTSDTTTLNQIVAKCNVAAGAHTTGYKNFAIEDTSDGTFPSNPFTGTLANGSTYTVSAVGGGGRLVKYTPGAAVTGTDTISPAVLTSRSNHTVDFYPSDLAAGYFTVVVTVVAPAAPTAALTSLTPNSIVAGNSSTVVVTLTNPNTTATLSGLGDTINLPSGVTVASTPSASTSCTSGSVTATAGAGTVTLSGGTLAPSASCTVTFKITAASTSGSPYAIPSGTPSATGANAGSPGTTAPLTVTAPPALAVAMTHSGNAVQGGTLSYTITPTVSDAATTTATLTATITLPAGMTFSSLVNQNGWTCGTAGQTGTCTRTTSIAIGTGPTIAYSATFATNAATPLVPSVVLSGGGATSDSPAGTDSTVVLQSPVMSGSINGGAAAYNAGGASATSIALSGSVSGTTTNYGVASSSGGTYDFAGGAVATTGGGTVSINASGVASYTPLANYRGADTFFVKATNGGANSGAGTVTVTVGNPTITASISGTPPARGAAASGFSVAPGGGKAPYTCLNESGSLNGLTLNANCTITGTPTTSGVVNFTTDIQDSSVTGTGGGTPSPFTRTAVPLSFTIAGANVATLSNLTLSAGTLSPGFTSPNGTYTASVPYATASVTATATLSDAAASFTVNGAPGTSGAASGAFALSVGANNLPIVVTAEDGSTTKTYTVTITRAALSPPTASVGLSPSTVYVGGTSTLTLTLTNPNGSNALAGVGETVTLPNGSLSAASLTTNGCGGSTNVTTSAVTLSGGTIAAGGTCTITASLTTSAAGSPSVSAGTPSATDASAGSAGNTATLTIQALPTAAAKSQAAAYNPGTPVTTSIDLSASVTGATYVRPASNPAHGTLDVSSGSNAAGTTLIYTPTAGYVGADSFTYYAVGSDGTTLSSGTATVSITVSTPTIALSPATIPAPTVGAAYSQPITASGGASGYTFAQTAGTLPTGLTLASNGTLSGTPTAGGAFSFTVTATDAFGQTGQRTYSTTVAGPTIALSPTTVPDGQMEVAYAGATITASGGTSPYTYSLNSGALPPGILLAANGTLSGTPTAHGSFNFTVQAQDSSTGAGPYTATRAYSITIAVPPPPVAGATSATIGFNSSSNPISLSLSGGTATGVSVSTQATHGTAAASGTTITYTPNAGYSGPDSFAYTASNDGGTSAPATVTITVSSGTVTVSSAAATGAKVGDAYSQANTASGGAPNYTYALDTGAFPVGTTIDPATGTVSGTPQHAGAYTYTVKATDSQGTPVTGVGGTVSGTIAKGDQTITFAALPSAYLSDSPLTLSATASSNLAVSFTSSTTSVCTVSGTDLTLLAAGTCTVNAAQAGDADWNAAAAVPQSFTVAPNAALTFATPGAASVALGGSITNAATSSVSGGGAITYSSGSPGVATVNATTGAITTVSAGTSIITATQAASPGVNAQATQTYTLTVHPLLTTTLAVASTTLAQDVAATPFAPVTASGGATPLSYAVSPALPAGLSIDSATGQISGTPTGGLAATNFTVTVTDAIAGTPQTSSKTFSLAVTATPAPVLSFATPGAAGVVMGGSITNAASTTIPAGGAISYSSGTPGVATVSAAGVITTVSPGTSVITATQAASPGVNTTASETYTLTVYPLLTTAQAQANVTLSVNVAAAPVTPVTASGGVGALNYGVSPALPSGLAFNAATGQITGTPTATIGATTFTVTVTDQKPGGAQTSSKSFQLTVAAEPTPVLSFATPSAASVVMGGAITNAATSTVPGGGAITYSSGSPGVAAVDATTGAITTVSPGTSIITATQAASPGVNAPATQTYTLTVHPQLKSTVTVASTTLTRTVAATPFTPVTGSGGVGTLSYSVSPGLPAGLSLNPSTGEISGTPTVALATTSFAVTVTDQTPGATQTTSQSFSLTVTGPPTVADKPGVAVPFDTATAIDLSASISGAAHSSLAVVTGPAHGAASVAGDVVTFTPTAGYYGADSFTYTATGPGGTSTAATVSLTVATPGAPAAAAKSAAAPFETATTIDLTASITGVHSSIAIGTAPAHGTTSVAGDVVTFTPAAGYYGADSFTYTATGPGGTSVPATVSISVGIPPAPTAAAKSATVPYETATAIDLAASVTGVHSSVAIATAPAHGTTAIAGDVVTFTPTAGYYGADSFAYTATGPGGTSGPATVSITIGNPAAPVVAAKTATVPHDTATAIDLSASITGVHSSIAIGTAPAHGTTAIAGDVVTFTPTAGYYGTDSFTYTATGPGGTSTPAATVTLTVEPPAAPTAAAKSATTPFNTAVAVDLAASITGVHSGVTIATAPTNGTTTIAGDVVTYTPTAGYSGADSFTYTANGPGGASAPATVSITIAPPPPPVTPPGPNGSAAAASSVASNGTVEIELGSLIQGVYTRVVITRQPQHGTVTLSNNGFPSGTSRAPEEGVQRALAAPTVIARYTPTAGYSGPDSFEFAAQGPGGTSTPATIGITVVGSRPVAAPKSATTGDGQTVTVDLTAGASEGPFTAAAIVSVSPSASVTATITDTGSGATRAFRLNVTPAARFGGTATIVYTLSNQYGVSAPATVTVTVTARPDPTQDPNVTAISDAQAETTRRFARSQVSNFMRRAEQLHGDGGSTTPQMGVTLASRDGRGMVRSSPAFDASAFAITERMRPSGSDPALGRMAEARRDGRMLRADELGSGAMSGLSGAPAGRHGATRGATRGAPEDGDDAADGRRIGSVAIWSGGSIDIGTLDAETNRTKITATTAGLSAGADIKLAPGVTVGVGGGYGNEVSHIGGGAASVRGTTSLYAAYASLGLFKDMFVDGMVGRGDLDFSTRRSATGGLALGSRDGDFTVGAISAGVDRGGEALRWSLYGRGEYLEADLASYVESGAGRYDLRFDARRIKSLTGTLGGRLEYRQKFAFGIVTPRLRAEWNHEFADADAQFLDYADIAGAAVYQLNTQGWRREQFSMALGTRFDLPPGWSFEIETGFRAASNQRVGTLRFQLGTKF